MLSTNVHMSEDNYATQDAGCRYPGGWTDRRMKEKGGVEVEGVLEETEKIKMKVK